MSEMRAVAAEVLQAGDQLFYNARFYDVTKKFTDRGGTVHIDLTWESQPDMQIKVKMSEKVIAILSGPRA